MKKQLFLLLFFTGSFVVQKAMAQCPLGIGINRDPLGFVCRDVPVTYTALPSNGATNPQYTWVVNGDTISTDSIITNSSPGQIVVYMTSTACPGDTASNNVLHQSVFYDIDYRVLITECNQIQEDVQIEGITSFRGTEPYTYDFLGPNGSLGQQLIYPDIPIGNYPVLVTDANSCMDTAWVNMSVLECPPPVPSEVVTPNGDGFNDYWTISNINLYPNNEVFIFDRWGQRVYHKKGYTNVSGEGWEVKYAGVTLPVSTYYYILKIENEKSDNITLKGAISVFR